MPRRILAALAALIGVVVLAAACDSGDGKTLRPPSSAERAAMPTTTTTTTLPGALEPTAGGELGTEATSAESTFSMMLPWADGGVIDARFTCDGADLSPAISWTAPPAGTVELALLVTDDNAGFYHWAVAGIDPASSSKAEGAPFAGAIEGQNDFGNTGYGGPCPPKGETHTYRFSLYALSQQAELPDQFTGKDLAAIADPEALTVAELTGGYTRAG